MPRGIQRGKVAGIDWQHLSYLTVTQGVSSITYPDLASFEADWTKHIDVGDSAVAPSIAVVNIGDSVRLNWDAGVAAGPGARDAYYEKSIGGLVAGATYDALITIQKGSGFNITNVANVKVDGALLGAGVPVGARTTLRHRFVSDGDVTIAFGEWNWNLINGSIEIFSIEFQPIESTSTPKLLRFRLDGSLAWHAPKEGSRNRRSEYGLGALYELPGVDYFLRGTARRIPQVGGLMDDGETITGWDEDGGWQDFLVAGRDKQLVTFYPDVSDLETSVACYLVEPMQGPPDPDGPGYYQLPIKLVSSSPFDGY